MLRNLKMKPKLMYPFLGGAGMAVIMGVVAIFAINLLSEHLNVLSDVRLPATQNLYQMAVAQNVMVAEQKAMLSVHLSASERDECAQRVAAARGVAEAARGAYGTLALEPSEKLAWQRLVSAWVNWQQANDSLVDKAKKLGEGSTAELAAALVRQSLALDVGALAVSRRELAGAIDMGHSMVSAIHENDERTASAAMLIMVACALTGILVALTLGRILAASVTQPVGEAVLRLGEMSRGDLSRRLDVDRGDELGEMVGALNVLAQNLSTMMVGVQANAAELSAASEELSAVSSDMASNSEETSTQAMSVASTVEEMSGNINSIASGAEQMSVNASNVASASEQMSHNINAVSAAIEQMAVSIGEITNNAQNARSVSSDANRMAEGASHTMNDLGRAAKEIGNVTDVIKRIAEQTNLLALNATIEAASAGDAGKGFAVVAHEIKELANQSAKAAGDIAARIDGVQANTHQAIEVIGDVTQIIRRIGEAVGAITLAVEQQTRASNEISNNVLEASRGARSIARAIAEVAKGSTDMSRNVGEAALGAGDVARSIANVSLAAGASSRGAHRVNEAAASLSKMAAALRSGVDRFKV